MDARQKVIDGDNATLKRHIEAVEAAQKAWVEAGNQWEADSTIEAHADALLESGEAYSQASDQLSKFIASAWHAGYRLHREHEDGA
jgi:hypothetical protein